MDEKENGLSHLNRLWLNFIFCCIKNLYIHYESEHIHIFILRSIHHTLSHFRCTKVCLMEWSQYESRILRLHNCLLFSAVLLLAVCCGEREMSCTQSSEMLRDIPIFSSQFLIYLFIYFFIWVEGKMHFCCQEGGKAKRKICSFLN